MIKCPCCASSMLRHIRHKGVYWFCPHCYQEMPNLENVVKRSHFSTNRDLSKLSFGLEEKLLVTV